ncbi:trihelix transcription factor ENAP1 [Euphorbia lathyris]|uniref:trihelix transcription factor ENAP1 n=1 Tax=Euphorbia lathyris TaxID=212925 RepID=UPI003313A0ED
MDDMEDEARFPPKSHSQNRSRRVPLYSHPVPSNFNPDYLVNGDDDECDDDDEFDEQNHQQFNKNDRYSHDLNEQTDGFDRYAKRQKLKNSVSNYEFVPRTGNSSFYSEGNVSSDWTEHDKFVLLEVWGDKFLQLGRNSLRSEDWVVVAEKVSEALKMNRTEVQCKQMMDLLKRRYRKERTKGGGKWAYFRKMDMLMSREFGTSTEFTLACGVDSGEYVFMDTDVYLERANGNDEMRDSPCDSEEEGEEEVGNGSGGKEGVKGLKVLADSVQKFGKIYEKIESSKREQMLELERMRNEFQRELELQKKQILERAQVEIAKIREVNDDEDEDSDDDDDDNVSE